MESYLSLSEIGQECLLNDLIISATNINDAMEKFAIDLDKVLDDFEFNEGKNYYLILFHIINRNISMLKL